MLLDFDELFRNPELQETIPTGYIDILNKTAPPGTHYELVDKDRCVLKADDQKFEIGGLVFKPSEKQKEALGDNYTAEDLMNYLYNSQTKGNFALENPGEIIINGENRSTDCLEESLNDLINITNIEVIMSPEALKGAFQMRVGNGVVEQILQMVRKPNDSISEVLFESEDEEKIQMSLIADMKNPLGPIRYTVKLGHPSTVKGLLENYKLYNSFVSGKMLIDGKELNPTVDIKDGPVISESDIMFWEKVLQLEEILDVQFKPMEVPMDMAVQVEFLYQSLVKKNPTRYEQRIDSLNGKAFNKNSEIPPQEFIGKPMLLEFVMKEEFDIFDTHIELPGLFGILNAVLQDYVEDEDSGKVEMKFADESEDKKLFATVILFKNIDELNEYRNGDQNDRVIKMQEAKLPIDFM